ncbi:MAG: hypothetical protein KDA44_19175 [Planctomycetales bacterium]|nr:hypothetical protein [Planctomycetales bacterium]
MNFRSLTLAALILAGGVVSSAQAQLRIVTYNTGTGQSSGTQTARSGMDIVLQAIGAEVIGGIAKPIDVLLLQEQYSTAVSTQSFVDVLNGIYGAGTYARSTLNALTSSPDGEAGGPALVYNTQTVDLIGEQRSGTVNGSAQARSTMRYQLRPVGYDAAADFYVYNDHYKSDTGSANSARRLIEATNIRNNSDALGEGTHAIYVGDYNIQTSSEDMYQHLLSAGAGQAFDPLNSPGSWNNNSSFRGLFTQSPATTSQYSGQTLGGLDDRFDFQLVTGELLDDEGLAYIPGSYHPFGNNGSVSCCNSPITSGNGASPTVLNALMTVSDHLPVVADYQLPAKMDVALGALPSMISVGAPVALDVFVQNIANVVAANGADELDYTLSVAGDLSGGLSSTAFALGGANAHQVFLDTSTSGLKSGVITVSSSSQGAAGALWTLPVSWNVGGGGAVVFKTIASDDFDAPLNRLSFSQTPLANSGTYNESTEGFGVYQVGVSGAIPSNLRDDSNNGSPTDSIGIVDTATKTDAWFGATNLANTNNATGEASATWEFDIAGASALQVSIDMAAMGDFEAGGGIPDFFNWTYQIDGGGEQPLFTSSVDEAGSATYTLADGGLRSVADPLSMTPAGGTTVELSNVFQTLTAFLTGVGDVLTLHLMASNDGPEAYAFDNILVEGLVSLGVAGDFDGDLDVDAADLAMWQTSFGLNDGGDANDDGVTDGADFLIWQRNYTGASAAASQAAVPEPTGAILVLLGATTCLLCGRRRWR